MRRANQLAFGRVGRAGSLTVRCECGAECHRWVSIPSESYESAVSRRRFVMFPGHEAPEDEIALSRRDYVLVERPGR